MRPSNRDDPQPPAIGGGAAANPEQTDPLCGTVLAGRFRILRRRGSGGMGVVYEAIDDALDRRVAIKCARKGHQTILPPEARTAREVSHFNVCKVYDLHLAAPGSSEPSFLSMEFVEGETLAARIAKEGALAASDARAVALQITAGLQQAHRQGVIHGDLKPGNVILAAGNRAVITDFGLAKFAVPDGSRIESAHGGTAVYMAPEMLRGEPATFATDIYALGVLFHVMVTGQTPKWLATPTASAEPPTLDQSEATATIANLSAAHIHRQPADDLAQPWKQVIAKCIAAEPAERFSSVEDVSAALQPRSWKLPVIAAVGVLAIAGGFAYWKGVVDAPGPAVRLAVLPFHVANVSNPPDVANDVAERLAGSGRNFTIITPAEARQNQVTTAEKAREILGATHVLETSLRPGARQGEVAAEVHLRDLAAQRDVRVLNSSYSTGDSATLAKALIGTVTLGLHLKPGRANSGDAVADAAYADYLQGLNLYRGDPRRANDAIASLEKAAALDPSSPLPLAALALAQAQKFRNGDGKQWLDRAGDTAAKASGMSPDSGPVLLATGQIEQLSGRYDQAIAAFNRASEVDPANPTAWRMLAQAFQAAGRASEAVATYRKAIQAEPGVYQSYLNFGNYYLSQGQYSEAEEMYRETTKLAPGLASGYMNLGLALKQQGRYPEAEQSLLQAQKLRPSARLALNIGALYYAQQRYGEALREFQESAKLGPATAALNRNLGDAYRHLGKMTEAAAAYRQARLQSEEEVTTDPRSAAARTRLALLSARLQDPHRASFELSQALSMDSGNASIIGDAVQTLELLRQRDRAFALLSSAPRSLLSELDRAPDLAEFRQDPRFQQLLQKPQ